MTQDAREALAALLFNWAETPDDVWTASPYHVEGIHEAAERAIRDRAPYDAWVRHGQLTAVPGTAIDYDWIA